MYNIEEIRENYKNFYDEKIIDIAQFESKGLKPEVLKILKEEIIKRNLDINLISWVEAESKPITDDEKEAIIDLIRNLPCPNCGKNNESLRAYEINTIISYFINCIDTTETKFLCSKCGNKKKLISIVKTLFFGLWSGKGFLLTPISLIKDIINLFFTSKVSNRIFDDFIELNIGTIRLNGQTKETMAQLIIIYNSKSV